MKKLGKKPSFLVIFKPKTKNEPTCKAVRVRFSFKIWSLSNNIRTMKNGSVIAFDIKRHLILFSFKRTA